MTYAVQITGTGGAALSAGSTITGSAQRDIVVSNGICRVRYPSISGHRGAHTFERVVDGAYIDAFNSTYGDRLLWITEFTSDPDRTVILRADGDMVEWAVIWDAHPVAHQAYWYDGSVIYSQSSAVGKTIATCKLWKVMCLRRGEDGYFVGVRTNPRTDAQRYPTDNNELAQFGDRSMGPGTLDSLVIFSSAGVTSRHPSATPNGQGSYHQWLGIDDPPGYSNQHAAYPAEQSTGPWWCGDMPNGIAVCRYVIMEHRLQVGALQYALGQYGSLVVVGLNDELENDGVQSRYQLFLGAFPYTTDAVIANEPTQDAEDAIVARVPDTWPPGESTVFWADGADAISEDAAKLQMAAAIEAVTPTTFGLFGFTGFRESTSNASGIEGWAAGVGADALRYFATRIGSSILETQGAGTLTTATCSVVVAYPDAADYDDTTAAALAAEDLSLIETTLGSLADVTAYDFTTSTSTSGRCLFATLSFTAEFWTA